MKSKELPCSEGAREPSVGEKRAMGLWSSQAGPVAAPFPFQNVLEVTDSLGMFWGILKKRDPPPWRPRAVG